MKSSDPRSGQPEDDVTSRAIEWILEQQEGFGPSRAEAFRAWCAADPSHRRAVEKAEDTLVVLGELSDLKMPLKARLSEIEPLERIPPRRRNWLGASAWAAAAAAVLAVIVWRWPTDTTPERKYVSNARHSTQVALDDGSLVDLNANTTIRTQMLAHERRISLREGEANFAVVHDSSRPFIVEAGGISIRAVGTAFNVLLNEKGVEILVFEGRVEISTPLSEEAENSKPRSQLVTAERAIITREHSSSSLTVEKVDTQAMTKAVAWHSSVTTISSRPLREIVELFNRRNQVRLLIPDPELGDRLLGGSFQIDRPQAFVRLLELDGDVVSEQHGENEIVLHRKR